MKLTAKQIQALETVATNRCQFSHIHPNTRRSLFKAGLIAKNWCHKFAMGDIEYLKLTEAGVEVAGKALCWEGY